MDYKDKLAELNAQMKKYSTLIKAEKPKPTYGLKGDEFDEILDFLEKRANDERND